jgi:single-stranded DNA-binding protein
VDNLFTIGGTVEKSEHGFTQNGTLWVRALVDVEDGEDLQGNTRTMKVPVVAFRAQAVTLKDVAPGARVLLKGRIRARSYETQTGETRHNVDLVVEEIGLEAAS